MANLIFLHYEVEMIVQTNAVVKGQVVFTKCGRDKGKAFVVINAQDEYLYLVDGKLRTLNKPKKKKAKHVQPVNYIASLEIDGRALQDADIRKELKAFKPLIS